MREQIASLGLQAIIPALYQSLQAIRMFVEAGGQHHRAHFHAYYQDQAAVFAVDTIECLGGSLPKAQQRLVEAWAEIHRAELEHDWDLLQSGRPPVKIEPLR